MNILAIGAHFDDVELGCAGALAVHVEKGDQVYVYVPTVSGFVNQYSEVVRNNEVAQEEAKAAMEILGVAELICGEFKTLEIEFIDTTVACHVPPSRFPNLLLMDKIISLSSSLNSAKSCSSIRPYRNIN